MKQHLLPEEWGEFERTKPESAKKLRDYYAKWQRNLEQERYPYSFVTIEYEPIFVWFDIGRMIEFLDIHTKRVEIKNYNDSKAWTVITRPGSLSIENSLCSCLWEKVQESLDNS